jgi:Glycosyl transferase family 2/Glycosyl transferases group 1
MSCSSGGSEIAAPGAGMRDLESFRGVHHGGTILVCGCGQSLNDLPQPDRFVTIGVNDVGRRFDPTYLVVVNPRSQFTAGRFRYIDESRARHVFTQLDLGLRHPGVVRFKLGRYGGTSVSDPGVLHYTRNSPYVALCLAAHMGARRIGLIGVDFTDDHFFGRTGTHALAAQLDTIDQEYRRLGNALSALGVEVFNLSPASRLTAFPKRTLPVHGRWGAGALAPADLDACTSLHAVAAPRETTPASRPKVFCITYRFLACGDVFTTGLRHAAQTIGVEWDDAAWDDDALPARVARFGPDLLFVVHGRRFVQRWGSAFDAYHSAVWLVDEPYEVDDTATFSGRFDHVFVNDAATLGRHANARYLPVCLDPSIHHPDQGAGAYDVGFVGGANPTRERVLAALAGRDLLSYVVGGPWRHPQLRRLALAPNIAARDVAGLYRATRIVVNVFRDVHHFNRQRIEPTSMNPRIYEALACGALVISESRPEIASRMPELPVFTTERELAASVERFLADPGLRQATRDACMQRLGGDTYADRLRTVLEATLHKGHRAPALEGVQKVKILPTPPVGPMQRVKILPTPLLPAGWEICGPVEHGGSDGALCLQNTVAPGPGSERGIVTCQPCRNVSLAFEVLIPSNACFVAKVNQAAKHDQRTNSYHVYCDGDGAYLARHHCVFKTLDIPRDRWVRLRLAYESGVLMVHESDCLLHSVRDGMLGEGFAFLGVKRGEVRLRDVKIVPALQEQAADQPSPAIECSVICPGNAENSTPRVSIVTTVYDRVACLSHCISSVRGLLHRDYQHIIVSDSPPPEVVDRIAALVRSFEDTRISYTNLHQRHNNWGIAPATVGLRQSRGEFICFLSDDNGYTPEHVGTLVAALDRDRSIGFAYSSCRYGGRLVLRHPVPAPARIDLGQPMFRRALFRTHLDDDLPFQMMAWDWALLDTLVKRGVRWKHVDVPSFIFRLARYPQLMVQP